MNITKESTGELTAHLIVEVREEDYQERVNKILKDYQRKANMPGFRPGKVPFGMVKKMYGTAVMADEINKMVSEELTAFIRDNDIKMLGFPIPNDEKTGNIDWSSQNSFNLYFDIGFAPEFELNLSEVSKPAYFKIKVSPEQIDEEVKNLTEQHAIMEQIEKSEETDWLSGEIVQIDESGIAQQNATHAETYVYPASLNTEEGKALFIGLEVEDSIEFDLRATFTDNKTIARLLKVTEKEAEKLDGKFRFTVKDISRMIPAEVNEALFKKVFPDLEEASEEKFRELIASGMERNYASESDKKFLQDSVDAIMQHHVFEIPEDFLKRWMLESNRGEVTEEEINKDFPSLSRSLKWDLVKQKISKQFDIKVTKEDLRDYVSAYLTGRFGNMPDNDDKKLDDIVNNILSKPEDAERIESDIFNSRLLHVLKDNLNPEIKETSVEEFIAVAAPKHDHEHDHDHNHDHDHHHDHGHECTNPDHNH